MADTPVHPGNDPPPMDMPQAIDITAHREAIGDGMKVDGGNQVELIQSIEKLTESVERLQGVAEDARDRLLESLATLPDEIAVQLESLSG